MFLAFATNLDRNRRRFSSRTSAINQLCCVVPWSRRIGSPHIGHSAGRHKLNRRCPASAIGRRHFQIAHSVSAALEGLRNSRLLSVPRAVAIAFISPPDCVGVAARPTYCAANAISKRPGGQIRIGPARAAIERRTRDRRKLKTLDLVVTRHVRKSPECSRSWPSITICKVFTLRFDALK